MEFTPVNINALAILNATHFATSMGEDLVNRVEDYKGDLRKLDRLHKRECKACYYLRGSRVGGQAITRTECMIASCRAKMTFPSTAVDKVCADCSEKHLLCVHCAGDIDGKKKRRRNPDGSIKKRVALKVVK